MRGFFSAHLPDGHFRKGRSVPANTRACKIDSLLGPIHLHVLHLHTSLLPHFKGKLNIEGSVEIT